MTAERMTRRNFLSIASGTMAAGIASSTCAADAESRPNILWLVSEDNNPYIGAYGDRLAHTPVIDRLARRGVLYRHAYANAPVCAVSRFGILTGVLAESCAPANHMRARARASGLLRGYPEYLKAAGYYCTNNSKTDYNCDIDPQKIWNESSTTAHWRNRPSGARFMSVFNYMTTHESMIFKPTAGRVKPEDVRVPAYLPDIAEIRSAIASYYNLMEKMDRQLGERLAELEADGLADDTIVFYYSDHGGVQPRSKHHCYDEGLHAPLIISLPEKYAHWAPVPMGSEVDSPVTFVDLAPTILALAGIPKPLEMVGSRLLGPKRDPDSAYAFGARNRMGERYDFVRTVTDGHHRYIRNYTPNRPWAQHQSYVWLHKGYQEWERLYLAGKLNPVQARFFGTKPYEELYDVDHDPDQVTNLVQQPDQQPRLERLRAALDQHLLSINDNGFIPEGSPLEGYDASRAPGAYPLDRIMPIASAAARRDVGALAAFKKGLVDSNEVVRYWSAQGLLMLGQHAESARAALHRSAREDLSPHVRVVAAEALAGLGEREAVRWLADMLDHAIYTVRLQAINSLTFIRPLAKEALPSIERAAVEDDAEDWTVRMAARYLTAVMRGYYDPSYPVFDLQWFQKRNRHE
jgi:arylsulfatase A-like enzyme